MNAIVMSRFAIVLLLTTLFHAPKPLEAEAAAKGMGGSSAIQLRTLYAPEGVILQSCLLSKDGGIIAISENAKGILYYRADLGSPIWSALRNEEIIAATITQDEKVIASDKKGVIYLIDINTGIVLRSFIVESIVPSMIASSGNMICAYDYSSKILLVYDVNADKEKWRMKLSIPPYWVRSPWLVQDDLIAICHNDITGNDDDSNGELVCSQYVLSSGRKKWSISINADFAYLQYESGLLWLQEESMESVASPLGTGHVKKDSRKLAACEWETGKEISCYPLEGTQSVKGHYERDEAIVWTVEEDIEVIKTKEKLKIAIPLNASRDLSSTSDAIEKVGQYVLFSVNDYSYVLDIRRKSVALIIPGFSQQVCAIGNKGIFVQNDKVIEFQLR